MDHHRSANEKGMNSGRRQTVLAILGISISVFIFCFTASTGTFGITIERTPTPDHAAISTLVALMRNGTQYARQATDMASQPTPTSSLAIIQGRICYPSQRVPAMRIYFNNTSTQEQYEFEIVENQTSYTVQLPPGKYYAWAWATQYGLGGFYSEYVACGMGSDCIDHRPLLFEVQAGDNLTGIDICDWGIPFPTDQIPSPS